MVLESGSHGSRILGIRPLDHHEEPNRRRSRQRRSASPEKIANTASSPATAAPPLADEDADRDGHEGGDRDPDHHRPDRGPSAMPLTAVSWKSSIDPRAIG